MMGTKSSSLLSQACCSCAVHRHLQSLPASPPPHTAPFRIFWLKAHLPHVTPMTCLICVPKLPWSRTKLCKSPLFKQILSRCVILTHFLSLPLHTVSLPSFPSSLISLPSTFKNNIWSKKWKCSSCSLVKIFIFFHFCFTDWPSYAFGPNIKKDTELYVLFNLNKHAKCPWHLGETNTSDRLEDGTKGMCWLFF